MKAGVLFIWTLCLLALALAALHFAFVATPRERLLTLALILAATCSLDGNVRSSHK